MKEYTYRFVNGDNDTVYISDEWAQVLSELDHKEQLINRKETRRHQSLDKLLGLDDYLLPEHYDEVFEDTEEKDLLFKRLLKSTLAKRQSQATWLRWHYGYRLKQVANEMGVSYDTAWSFMKAAKNRIQKLLSCK